MHPPASRPDKLLVLFALATFPGACAPSPATQARSPSSTAATATTCPGPFAPVPAGVPPAPQVTDEHAEEPIAPAWELRPGPGRTLTFSGIVDDEGSTYWTESTLATGAAELASATRDGALRFRSPMAAPGPIALAGSLLVSASTTAGGCRQDGAPAADAYSAANGAHVWHRDLLPVLEAWMRGGGSCRYGSVTGFAVQGARIVVAVSILDHDTAEHESGYVALDPATGEVVWSTRTSPSGNAMRSGPPRVAADGTAYGSRTASYQRDEILVLADGGVPQTLWTPASPWHGAVVATAGFLMVTEATGGSSWAGPPVGLEVRCRTDGAPLGGTLGIAKPSVPLLSAGRVWFFGDQLASYDATTGQLRWRVALTTAPAPTRTTRPLVFRSSPIVTGSGSILFTEQPGAAGAVSSSQQLETPRLREIDVDGREVLRRQLPLEHEAFDGSLAVQRGRVYVGGQVLPSAGAYGVVRAFDVPGRDAAPSGWMTPGGSLAHDNRAR